jgi:hypothetical protein
MNPDIDTLREMIRSAHPSITEGVKWNAPSFRTTEWFATVNLRAKKRTAVILHFGAKKNAISETGVAIDDPQGLLQWLGKDRAQVSFADAAELAGRREAFAAVIRQWITHL